MRDIQELVERLQDARNTLEAMAAGATSEQEKSRLSAKADGVGVALSYAREYDREVGE